MLQEGDTGFVVGLSAGCKCLVATLQLDQLLIQSRKQPSILWPLLN